MPGALTPDGFATRFEAAFRGLWCIAVAIVRDHDLAEDVLQDAAVVALRKLDRFDPQTNFGAWMGQIVRYVALNTSKRARRRRPADLELETLPEGRPGSDSPPPIAADGRLQADQDSFDDRVVAALDHLEETARACLLLRTVARLSYRDIALALGVPEGTAMSHVHRSRATMRRLLVEEQAPAPTEVRSHE